MIGSIAVGENFEGMIDKIIIRDASDAQAAFHIERNELQKVSAWLGARKGIQQAEPTQNYTEGAGWGPSGTAAPTASQDAGVLFVDDVYASTIAQNGFYRFHQAINFASMKNPVMEVQIDPSQETGISVFACTIKFAWTPSAVQRTEYLSRTYTAAETRSEIDLGEYPVIDLMWSSDVATLDNLQSAQLTGADGNFDVNANEPMELMHYVANFQTVGGRHSTVTGLPTTWASGPIWSEPHSKRKLVTRSVANSTMTVHYLSVARLIDFDETRSPLGPASRTGRKAIRSVRATKGGKGKVARAPAKAIQKYSRTLGGGFHL